jgi:hypothetical protein
MRGRGLAYAEGERECFPRVAGVGWREGLV